MSERDELVAHLTDPTSAFLWMDRQRAADQIERDGQEIERLTAENQRLREALQPFASAADDYCGEWMEDDYSPFWAEFFVCGDFRRARAALNGEGET